MLSVECLVFSVQCLVFSVECLVFSVQCLVSSVQGLRLKVWGGFRKGLERVQEGLRDGDGGFWCTPPSLLAQLSWLAQQR